MTLQEVVNLVKQLSRVDKVRLIKQVVPEIEKELIAKSSTPRQSLWGLCADLGKAPSADEIDRVRREEWASFPREYF
jgi:hypothetical protein